jgi:hypothetical protein
VAGNTACHCTSNLKEIFKMAKAKTPKAQTTVEIPSDVETTSTVESTSPFAALLAAPAAPVAPAKVHALQVGDVTYRTANHVATFKGVRGVPANMAGTSYKLGKPYAPVLGRLTTLQWQATVQAIVENGGSATVAQVAQAFAANGMAAGLAPGFVAYRAKAGSLVSAS